VNRLGLIFSFVYHISNRNQQGFQESPSNDYECTKMAGMLLELGGPAIREC